MLERAFLLGVLPLLGCGGTVVHYVVADDGGTDSIVETPVPDAPARSIVDGTWVGYIETYKFPSGSDKLAMTLKGMPDGTVVGTMVFGEKPAPPPPTDPERGYPPGFDVSAPPLFFGEGFVHTVIAGKLAGKRLTFKITSTEVFKKWCELQTSYPGSPGCRSCLPNWGLTCCGSKCTQTNPDTGEIVPRDCGKLYLCAARRVCECSTKGCTTKPDGDTTFDIAFSGGEANGSTIGAFFSRNVHFTRTK